MLHIITPAYRFENLKTVYDSIFADNDIKWHITKSNKREDIPFDFIKTDKRIILHNVDCEDNQVFLKRNKVFETIKDGYFCLLDDDTIFHENMYFKYRECQDNNFRGMLVGQQMRPNGTVRLTANPPKHYFIDTGNVLSHTSCLSECRWPDSHIQDENNKDFLFWLSVYNFYGKKCALSNSPISIYNKLNDDKSKKGIPINGNFKPKKIV